MMAEISVTSMFLEKFNEPPLAPVDEMVSKERPMKRSFCLHSQSDSA